MLTLELATSVEDRISLNPAFQDVEVENLSGGQIQVVGSVQSRDDHQSLAQIIHEVMMDKLVNYAVTVRDE